MGIEKWAEEEGEGNFILSEESAEKCVRELLSFYRIKPGGIEPKETAQAFSHALDRIKDGYREGLLENKRNEDGGIEIAQKIKEGKDSLTYRELIARDKRVMDNYGPHDYVQKQQALLGKLCGLGPDAVGSLKRGDLQLAEALGFLFFMA